MNVKAAFAVVFSIFAVGIAATPIAEANPVDAVEGLGRGGYN